MNESTAPRLITRDVVYTHAGTRMVGYLCAPEGPEAAPGLMLIHDAFGLGDDMCATTRRYAALGYAVFAVDLWGERFTPGTESEIGLLIGGMVGDRTTWMARLAAAHDAIRRQPEFNGNALVALGYCFGGTSALEYLRTTGAVRGVVSIHGGLDMLDFDWATTIDAAQVLVCTGADDPMAPADLLARLEAGMSSAGIDWETVRYGNTKHGFTNPASAHSPNPAAIGYHARNAARVWERTELFLAEVLNTEILTASAPAVVGS